MGIVMFGGIVFSAILTFFVVPAAFYAFERNRKGSTFATGSSVAAPGAGDQRREAEADAGAARGGRRAKTEAQGAGQGGEAGS